jgi:hypothetical protein
METRKRKGGEVGGKQREIIQLVSIGYKNAKYYTAIKMSECTL